MLGTEKGEVSDQGVSAGHIRVWKTGLAHNGSARLLYDTSPLYVDYGSQIYSNSTPGAFPTIAGCS